MNIGESLNISCNGGVLLITRLCEDEYDLLLSMRESCFTYDDFNREVIQHTTRHERAFLILSDGEDVFNSAKSLLRISTGMYVTQGHPLEYW